MAETLIQTRKNGPYLVKGAVKLVDYDGNEYQVDEAFALCRCGQSAKKPFCDGMHRQVGFVAEEMARRP